MQSQAAEREFDFRPEDFRFLAAFVLEKTGIVLAEHKQDMVYARIARRLRSLRLDSFSAYCELLKAQENDELVNLVNAITTNMTSFFRERHHFDHLRDEVLKKHSGQKRLRLWSAASSTGAEPYSMAISCMVAIPDIDRWDVKILATDIDTNVLAKCRAGIYSAEEVEPIAPELRKRFTAPAGDGKVVMHDKLKNLIVFKPLNLIEAWPFKGPFDAVFCRNVVIYFNKQTQQQLFSRMADYIRPQGWLYIGHSESLHGISERFSLKGKTTYRKER